MSVCLHSVFTSVHFVMYFLFNKEQNLEKATFMKNSELFAACRNNNSKTVNCSLQPLKQLQSTSSKTLFAIFASSIYVW